MNTFRVLCVCVCVCVCVCYVIVYIYIMLCCFGLVWVVSNTIMYFTSLSTCITQTNEKSVNERMVFKTVYRTYFTGLIDSFRNCSRVIQILVNITNNLFCSLLSMIYCNIIPRTCIILLSLCMQERIATLLRSQLYPFPIYIYDNYFSC
jgi:hypothetical protein